MSNPYNNDPPKRRPKSDDYTVETISRPVRTGHTSPRRSYSLQYDMPDTQPDSWLAGDQPPSLRRSLLDVHYSDDDGDFRIMPQTPATTWEIESAWQSREQTCLDRWEDITAGNTPQRSRSSTASTIVNTGATQPPVQLYERRTMSAPGDRMLKSALSSGLASSNTTAAAGDRPRKNVRAHFEEKGRRLKSILRRSSTDPSLHAPDPTYFTSGAYPRAGLE